MTAVGYPKDYSYLKINVKYIAKFNTSKKRLNLCHIGSEIFEFNKRVL